MQEGRVDYFQYFYPLPVYLLSFEDVNKVVGRSGFIPRLAVADQDLFQLWEVDDDLDALWLP